MKKSVFNLTVVKMSPTMNSPSFANSFLSLDFYHEFLHINFASILQHFQITLNHSFQKIILFLFGACTKSFIRYRFLLRAFCLFELQRRISESCGLFESKLFVSIFWTTGRYYFVPIALLASCSLHKIYMKYFLT